MKSLVKTIIFLFLEGLGINAYFRYKNRGRVNVLLFHSISTPGKFFNNSLSERSFVRQLDYLLKRYSFLKLNQMGEFEGYDSQKVNILLTFDDGFIDNYLIAAPILAGLKLSAVFFVIANCLQGGDIPIFIRNKSNHDANNDAYRTVKADQVVHLMQMGMTIGSHSLSHQDYKNISIDAGLRDAIDSKLLIEEAIGGPVQLFAFPWGKYHDSQLKDLRGSFLRLFTTEHGFSSVEDSVFRRNEVANYLHLSVVASGSLNFLSKFFRPR